jgi:hypothetical protein
MKLKITRYRYQFSKAFRSHEAFVAIVITLLILIGAVLRVSMLNNLPIDQNYLVKKTNAITSVKFNHEAIEQIQTLNQSNVSTPGTELPSNRQNPFSE